MILRIPRPSSRLPSAATNTVVVALVALVYWPVHDAGFVWDDKVQLHDTAWLRHGNDWIVVVLHGFADWTNYFRPLGIAFWVAEGRLLDLSAGPMHLVSLCLHLVNTLLVGLLARMLVRVAGNHTENNYVPSLAMLVYGLHPLLVEPVVWIASQFEVILTFLTLLGLILNYAIENRVGRAIGVGACFFLAACTKETALTFPMLLVIFDWIRPQAGTSVKTPLSIRVGRLREQLPVYGALLLAGGAYLAFRGWGLGFLIPNAAHDPLFSWSRFQVACFTYASYWKLLLWPMSGLGPLHLFAQERFVELTLETLAFDIGALAILSTGLYTFWLGKPFGGLIMAVTATLLPVLHIVPVSFDDSLYHDRYAMTAAAMACAFMPLVISDLPRIRSSTRFAFGGNLIAAFWLIAAILNIRANVPLWSDEVRLWQWALRQNPGSLIARENLLSAYLERNDLAGAQPLVDSLMASKRECLNCLLNAVDFAIVTGNTELADTALERAKSIMENKTAPRRLLVMYLLASGGVSGLHHDWNTAEQAYRTAIATDPLDPNPHMNLATVLARRGLLDDARRAADTALALYPPDVRSARQREIEAVLAKPALRAPGPAAQAPDR